jgi:type IV pilus assembly protein PilE
VQTRTPSVARGLTLVELLTVIVIIAILSAVAIPSYRSYVLRSQRTEATRALLQVRAAQEKFFVQNNRYADDLDAAPPAGLGMSSRSETGLYALQIALLDGGRSFSVQATPSVGSPQTEDERCQTFNLDGAGLRSALNATATDNTRECWR